MISIVIKQYVISQKLSGIMTNSYIGYLKNDN